MRALAAEGFRRVPGRSGGAKAAAGENRILASFDGPRGQVPMSGVVFEVRGQDGRLLCVLSAEEAAEDARAMGHAAGAGRGPEGPIRVAARQVLREWGGEVAVGGPSCLERQVALVQCLLRRRVPIGYEEIRRLLPSHYGGDGAVDADERTVIAAASSPAAERRTFHRDVTAIMDAGIEVLRLTDPENPRRTIYHVPRHLYDLPVCLDADDALVLADLSRRARHGGGRPLAGALRLAMLKVTLDCRTTASFHRGGGVAGRGGWTPAKDAWLPAPPGEDHEATVLPNLAEAIAGGRTILFLYVGRRGGRPTGRTVDPYGVFWADGAWYLVGRLHGGEPPVRTFKVCRIAGRVEAARRPPLGVHAPPDFERPEGFSIETYARMRPWDLGRPESIDADLAVDVDLWPEVAPLVRPEERLDDGPVGEVRVRVAEADPGLLTDWVLRHAGRVRVLGPARLRRVLAGRLDALEARCTR